MVSDKPIQEKETRLQIIFIGLNGSSFCHQDEVILSRHFTVKAIYLDPPYLTRLPSLLISMLKEIRRTDLVYIWFGDTWAVCGALLARCFGKKSIIVAGGYDVANEPSIQYGLMARPLMRFVPKLAFGTCDRIAAVSDFIKEEALKFVKDPERIVVIYNGVDTSLFRNTGEKRDSCITVGNVTPRSYRVKGIDKFLEVAEFEPNVKFVLVGRTDLGVNIEAKENLELAGFQSGEELVSIMNRSKFYLQLSVREGFGLAVAEAMACGCIPIVTDRGALPSVVGDAGHIIPFGDWKKVAEMAKGEYDEYLGKKAQSRTVEQFSIKKRERMLVALITDIIDN